MKQKTLTMPLLAGLLACGALVTSAHAELSQITVARQYGVSYLPLMVMQQEKLIEKQAKAEGIANLKVDWVKFAGGNVMNDALISDSLQFASGGVRIKRHFTLDTHGFVLADCPSVIKDFTDKDKIALPAVKVSIQAVTLQMAAAQAFGEDNYDKLDKYTVTMSHPDGMTALLSGAGEVDSHFTSPPFQYKELEDPHVHTVLSSFDVLGGPATFNVIWTTSKFRKDNPKLYKAFTAALAEAIDKINKDKKWGAEEYIKAANSKDSVDFIYKILTDPKVEFTMTPKATTKYSDFLYKVGAIKVKPQSWKDMFFSNVHGLPGS